MRSNFASTELRFHSQLVTYTLGILPCNTSAMQYFVLQRHVCGSLPCALLGIVAKVLVAPTPSKCFKKFPILSYSLQQGVAKQPQLRDFTKPFLMLSYCSFVVAIGIELTLMNLWRFDFPHETFLSRNHVLNASEMYNVEDADPELSSLSTISQHLAMETDSDMGIFLLVLAMIWWLQAISQH